jgi:hypothetical protein
VLTSHEAVAIAEALLAGGGGSGDGLDLARFVIFRFGPEAQEQEEDNLTAVQKRCNEILEERRLLQRLIYTIGLACGGDNGSSLDVAIAAALHAADQVGK